MDFSLSEDAQHLAEGARAFLRGENTLERLRGPELASGLELMQKLASLGWFGIEAPETLGGLALTPVESAILADQAGQVALPEPLLETIGLVVPLAVRFDCTDLARSVIAGNTTCALASTLNPSVNHFEAIDQVLLVTPQRVALARPADCLKAHLPSIDPWRWLAAVDLNGQGRVLATGETAAKACAWIEARGAVLVAAELCGLADRMIELATEYARTREQFGAPIGSFQAVKHLLANARVRLEFARPVVYRAAAALAGEDGEHPPARDRAAAHAKLAATTAATLASENAIQVFGAMGYTHEADLHFFMKRSWALAGLWGDREYHLRQLDAWLFSPSAAIGPGTSYETE